MVESSQTLPTCAGCKLTASSFELTFTLLWRGCSMTDNVPQHNLPPPHIALHLLCDAVDPFTNHPQLYTSAACQHLPGALTRPTRNEKLSLLASTQQVYRPLGQLLGNATDLVVRESQTNTEVWLKEALAATPCVHAVQTGDTAKEKRSFYAC